MWRESTKYFSDKKYMLTVVFVSVFQRNESNRNSIYREIYFKALAHEVVEAVGQQTGGPRKSCSVCPKAISYRIISSSGEVNLFSIKLSTD